MPNMTVHNRRRSVVALRSSMGLVVALALAAAGCGSDGSSASSSTSGAGTSASPSANDGVSTAKANLAAAEKELAFQAPGPEIKVGESLQGKTIIAVLNDLSAPFTQSVISGMEEAAAVVGMKVEAVDGKQSTATASTEIEKAVSRNPAAIVVGAFQSDALSAALGEAKSAKIPVIEQANREAGPLPEAVRALGVSASVGFCYTCAGKTMADAAIADSNGTANIGIININDVPVSNIVADAFKDEIKSLCPDCKVQVIDTPAATTSPTVIAGLTSAFVNKNSGPVYMVPTFDYYVPQVASALAEADAEDRAKLISWNAGHASMQMLQEGKLVLALLGSSPGLLGWATIDAAVRLVSGKPAVEDPEIPVRAFTAKNIGDIDLSSPESEWYGGGYQEVYKSLWGHN